MDEVLGVYVLYPRDKLVCEEQDRFQAEPSRAEVEEVLEAWSQEVHHQHVVVAFNTKPPDVRDSHPTLNDLIALWQGCHSEFGSNKVRKMVRQGKEKRLLARIFKILGKARKRLSRQNSTIKVRKCEEKRPEFTKKARKRLSRQNSTRKVRKCEEK